MNRFIWPIDETLTDTTTPGQSDPGSKGNEGVFYTPSISITRALLSNAVVIPKTLFSEKGVSPPPVYKGKSAYSKPHWQDERKIRIRMERKNERMGKLIERK